MRTTLVTALTACAAERDRKRARRFLQGLSGDELQFIADFLGACILESSGGCGLGGALERFRQACAAAAASEALDDREHKLILLLEYLCRCHVDPVPVHVRASGHAG